MLSISKAQNKDKISFIKVEMEAGGKVTIGLGGFIIRKGWIELWWLKENHTFQTEECSTID